MGAQTNQVVAGKRLERHAVVRSQGLDGPAPVVALVGRSIDKQGIDPRRLSQGVQAVVDALVADAVRSQLNAKEFVLREQSLLYPSR